MRKRGRKSASESIGFIFKLSCGFWNFFRNARRARSIECRLRFLRIKGLLRNLSGKPFQHLRDLQRIFFAGIV